MDVMKRMPIALLMTLCVFAALAGSAGAQDQGLSGRQNVVSAGVSKVAYERNNRDKNG